MIKQPGTLTHNMTFPPKFVAFIFILGFIGIADAQGQRFQFSVMGDTSYSKVSSAQLRSRAVAPQP